MTPQSDSVRRPTPDDWHPTRADGTVRVSVSHLEGGLGFRRA